MSEQESGRGQLRIYLGAAPGVGKTYAMLGEGQRRAGRGTDVVVGFVDTQGREKVAKQLEGLEVVAPRPVPHHGAELAEMDIDAVLARAPRVALVDDLAHTNAPGSRNAKRWQDIDELLDAGITVLSTVNVDHLESLRDVVERITGVSQSETVPDDVVRRAEQVELVDITPEALRRRMAHGNIYPPDRIDAALSRYFRPGNLTALRELALLWLADQVDIALQRYKAEKDITDTWEARERVVVAVTGGAESETLIRRAARIAAHAGGGKLLVVHVLRGEGTATTLPTAHARLRRLADDVGASFHTVVGTDVPATLLEFARGVDATQLVLGISRRSRLAQLFVEGIGPAILRQSGSIDVHMVTHDEAGRGLRLTALRRTLSPARRAVGWVLSVLLPAAATGLGSLNLAHLDVASVTVLYFMAAAGVAVVGGLGPAMVAAGASGLLLNFFFTEPRYTISAPAALDVLAVIGMVLIGVTVSVIVTRATKAADRAARASTEAALMASFARVVMSGSDPVLRLLSKIRETFGLASVAVLQRNHGEWERVASSGLDPCDVPGQADIHIPIDDEMHLAVRGRQLEAAERAVLSTAAGQAVLTLRGQQASRKAAEAQRKAETTEVRTTLLSAVSHDLQSPLKSIKTSVGTLASHKQELPATDGALLTTIATSTDQLCGLVDNLLDASRLVGREITPTLKSVRLDEIVPQTLDATANVNGVLMQVPDTLPPVLADPELLSRVVGNVLNGAVSRASGTKITIRGSEHAGEVQLRVCDHGPALLPATAETIFEPVHRLGDDSLPGGVGIGMKVARGFMDLMGGTIEAEDTPGGGLTVVISLPTAES